MSKIDVFIHESDEKYLLPKYLHLCLTEYSKVNNHIVLSPQLVSNQEVDYYVDSLIKELEKARKKAKKILAK